MQTQAVEFELDTSAGRLCGLRWSTQPSGTDAAGDQNSEKPRVLALHGWLDNAASFSPMAPFMTEVELVALDFPGHGHSDWRPDGCWYHYIDYIGDALRAAEALGWSSFHLLGHSLGARVGSALAAACPQKILSLSLIEGLGAACVTPDQLVGKLRQAVSGMAALSVKQRRVFDSIEVAVKARHRSGDLDLESTRLLVERSVEAIDGGWRWRSDPRLTLASPMRLVESQAMALLDAVEAPTLVINAEPLKQLEDPATLERRVAVVGDVEQLSFPGHHHLHMQTPQPIAEAVVRHIWTVEARID